MAQITKDTIISEVLERAPEAVPILRALGMNCLGCAMAGGESLGQACAAHGVDADEIVSKLNALVAN